MEALLGLILGLGLLNAGAEAATNPPLDCYYEAPVYAPVSGSTNLQSLLSKCEVK